MQLFWHSSMLAELRSMMGPAEQHSHHLTLFTAAHRAHAILVGTWISGLTAVGRTHSWIAARMPRP